MRSWELRRRTEWGGQVSLSDGQSSDSSREPCGKGCAGPPRCRGRGAVEKSQPGAQVGTAGKRVSAVLARQLATGSSDLSKGVVGRLWAGRWGRSPGWPLGLAESERTAAGAVHRLSTSPVGVGASHRVMVAGEAMPLDGWDFRCVSPSRCRCPAEGRSGSVDSGQGGFRYRMTCSGKSTAGFPERRLVADGENGGLSVYMTACIKRGKRLPAVCSKRSREVSCVRCNDSLQGANSSAARAPDGGGDRKGAEDVGA